MTILATGPLAQRTIQYWNASQTLFRGKGRVVPPTATRTLMSLADGECSDHLRCAAARALASLGLDRVICRLDRR